MKINMIYKIKCTLLYIHIISPILIYILKSLYPLKPTSGRCAFSHCLRFLFTSSVSSSSYHLPLPKSQMLVFVWITITSDAKLPDFIRSIGSSEHISCLCTLKLLHFTQNWPIIPPQPCSFFLFCFFFVCYVTPKCVCVHVHVRVCVPYTCR